MNSTLINFTIFCPIEDVEEMKLVGNIENLGLWVPEKGQPLTNETNENFKWVSQEPIFVQQGTSIEFKACAWQQGSNQVVWEPLPFSNHKIQATGEKMDLQWEFGNLSIMSICGSQQIDNNQEIQQWKTKYQNMVNIQQEKELAQQSFILSYLLRLFLDQVMEITTALKNEKKNTEEANKKIAMLETQIKDKQNQSSNESSFFKKTQVFYKGALSELQGFNAKLKTDIENLKQVNNKNQEANQKEMEAIITAHQEENKKKDNEIAKLKQNNADQQKQIEDAKQNVQKTSKENIELRAQIESQKKEILDLKAQSSKQEAPQAAEQNDVKKESAASPAQEVQEQQEEIEQGKAKGKGKKNKNKQK